MKRGHWRSHFENSIKKKPTPQNKKPWRSLVGNLLLSNLIALVISLIQFIYARCGQGEDVNWILNFLINNGIGLTVWAFNLFFPWE